MSNIINIPINKLYGKVVCKYQLKRIQLKKEHGQYPKIGWLHESGVQVNRSDVKYKIIKIKESPQYKFIKGEEEYFKEYMCVKGWKSGYGHKRVKAVKNFQKLINTFNQYLDKENKTRYIECVKEGDRYLIVDGLHRCSILYNKDEDMEIKIKVIRCGPFVNLPM